MELKSLTGFWNTTRFLRIHANINKDKDTKEDISIDCLLEDFNKIIEEAVSIAMSNNTSLLSKSLFNIGTCIKTPKLLEEIGNTERYTSAFYGILDRTSFVELMIDILYNESDPNVLLNTLDILWVIYSIDYVEYNEYMKDNANEKLFGRIYELILDLEQIIDMSITEPSISNDILKYALCSATNIIYTNIDIQEYAFERFNIRILDMLNQNIESVDFLDDGMKFLFSILQPNELFTPIPKEISPFIDFFYSNLIINNEPYAFSIWGLYKCTVMNASVIDEIFKNMLFPQIPDFLENEASCIPAMHLISNILRVGELETRQEMCVLMNDWKKWKKIAKSENPQFLYSFVESTCTILDHNWSLVQPFLENGILGRLIHFTASGNYEYEIRKKSFKFFISFGTRFTVEQEIFLLQNGFLETFSDFIPSSSDKLFISILSYLSFISETLLPAEYLVSLYGIVTEEILPLVQERDVDETAIYHEEVLNFYTQFNIVNRYLEEENL